MRLIRISALIICAALGLSACLDIQSAPTKSTLTVLDESEVIALIPGNRNTRKIRTGAQDLGFVLREDIALQGLKLRMLRFTFPPNYTGKSAIDALETIETTATAGVNHVYQLASDTGINRFDYANDMIAWPSGGCAPRGPVGLLDTAVDAAALRASGVKITAKNFARGQASATRHGTDVATVLTDPNRVSGGAVFSAAVVGRMADGSAVAGADAIVKALDWMAAQDVKLVNVSLAGPYNKILDRGVQNATANGMVIVAAVGNEGAGGPPRFPAAFDTVVAVTAVDASRKIYRKAVRGQHVDIAAPGVDIPVIRDGGVRFVTGTSMAAPYVTARIATDPALYGRSVSQIRASLSKSSEDLGAPGTDPTFGAGLMRAADTCSAG